MLLSSILSSSGKMGWVMQRLAVLVAVVVAGAAAASSTQPVTSAQLQQVAASLQMCADPQPQPQPQMPRIRGYGFQQQGRVVPLNLTNHQAMTPSKFHRDLPATPAPSPSTARPGRPFLAAVHRRRYRLRILNASNARYFNVSFSNVLPFHVVGSDASYLADFSRSPTDEVEMLNSAPYPFPAGTAPGPLNGKVMKFIVTPMGPQHPPDNSTVPGHEMPCTGVRERGVAGADVSDELGTS
ncbi:hypothetical protein ACP4OV_022383 [Aristida adscensionis]